jgi:hypothetical protein
MPQRRFQADAFTQKVDAFRANIANSASAANPGIETAHGTSTVVTPSRAEAVANAVCDGYLETAFAEFVVGLPDMSAELLGASELGSTFANVCSEAIDQTLGTFDALASDYDGTPVKLAKRKELLARVFGELQPLYRSQIKKLVDEAWDQMRKKLVKLRLGDPSLLQEMESSVKAADVFFRDRAKAMAPAGATWSSDLERRDMVTKMRAFVTERLQAARLQGSYVPGMLRRPVAVSLHYLASHPFQLLDALQDSLSYEEDMDWQPEKAIDRKRVGALGK